MTDAKKYTLVKKVRLHLYFRVYTQSHLIVYELLYSLSNVNQIVFKIELISDKTKPHESDSNIIYNLISSQFQYMSSLCHVFTIKCTMKQLNQEKQAN